VGGFILEYKKANALDNLKILPAWKTAPEAAKEDPDGMWVGKSISYWCMAYNNKKVGREDLPKKWEDLVTNPKWRNGNLALANRPQVWALNVWAAHGEQWTKDFLTKLFIEVKPQLRKEGLNLMPQLAGAGEFLGALPSSPARTSQMADDGAPVGLVCPEPLPASTASVMILKGSPNLYSARIFVNWLLSKEGQIAQFAAKRFTPIHKDLQRKEFVPFPDQVLGKKVSYSNPMTELAILPQLYDHWNKLWVSRGR
jgi:iron(III) transport system substrate-binding protein